MKVTIKSEQGNNQYDVECRYPFILSFIILGISLTISFVFLGLGLHDVNQMSANGATSYHSPYMVISIVAFFVMFDMLLQLSATFAGLHWKGYEVITGISTALIFIIFYVVYCSALHVKDFTALLWAPILFGVSPIICFFRVGITVMRGDKLYYERTAVFVILSVVFDVLLFSIITVIMSYFIWFIIFYAILCVILRREPIGYIIIIIVR